MLFLELRQEVLDSSRVGTGNSGNLSCCLIEVRPPFELREAHQDFSRVAAGD